MSVKLIVELKTVAARHTVNDGAGQQRNLGGQTVSSSAVSAAVTGPAAVTGIIEDRKQQIVEQQGLAKIQQPRQMHEEYRLPVKHAGNDRKSFPIEQS